MLFTSLFWKGAGERALKTFLQSFIPALLLALGAASSDTFNAWTAPWLAAVQIASGIGLGAAFLSLCTSVGNADFVSGTPLVTTVASPTDVATITTLPAPDELGAGPVPDDDAPAAPDDDTDTSNDAADNATEPVDAVPVG